MMLHMWLYSTRNNYVAKHLATDPGSILESTVAGHAIPQVRT